MITRRRQHMGGILDDVLSSAGVSQVIDDQRTKLAQTASGVANQAIAAGVARAQQAIAESSRQTIKNAMVAAFLLATVIGGAAVAWGYVKK